MASWWTIVLICVFIQSVHANTLSAGDTFRQGNDASDDMFAMLLNRIGLLEDRLDARDQKIDLLEEKVKVRDDKIEKLEEKMAEHDRYINLLRETHEEDTTQHRDETGSVDNKAKEVVDNILEDAVKSADKSDELETIQDAVKRVAKQSGSGPVMVENKKPQTQGNRIRRSENEVDVAFFATLSSITGHIGQYQDVIFNNVETNIGNGYNNNVGAFVAPVAGTYVFSVSLTTYQGHSTHYGIYKNTSKLTQIWLNGSDNDFDSSSQSVVLHLAQGDTITVKHIESDHSLAGYDQCLFSGFLLTQEFTGTSPVIVGK